jgi:hypothetical protein
VAKKAGVKLIVNGHWGSPVTGETVPAAAHTLNLRLLPNKAAEEVGLPWVEFRSSTFLVCDIEQAPYVADAPVIGYRITGLSCRTLLPFSWSSHVQRSIRPLGLSQLGEGKATIYGDGTAENSWTDQPDIARYVWHVLLHLPASSLHNRQFNIAGRQSPCRSSRAH